MKSFFLVFLLTILLFLQIQTISSLAKNSQRKIVKTELIPTRKVLRKRVKKVKTAGSNDKILVGYEQDDDLISQNMATAMNFMNNFEYKPSYSDAYPTPDQGFQPIIPTQPKLPDRPRKGRVVVVDEILRSLFGNKIKIRLIPTFHLPTPYCNVPGSICKHHHKSLSPISTS